MYFFLLSNSYFLCECMYIYCKIPTFCKYCSSILINDVYLNCLLSKELEPESKTNFKIMAVSDLQSYFLNEKELQINDKYLKINIEDFYSTWINFISIIKNSLKKDYLAWLSQETILNSQLIKKECTRLQEIKFILIYLKNLIGVKIYANIEMINHGSINALDHSSIASNKINFFLAKDMTCRGCENSQEENVIKMNNYSFFSACCDCLEILCQDCVDYLKMNNLGCWNCSSL